LPLGTPNGIVVGIGKKGKDNGVLVLVAMVEREWRIETGYGLEGYITDIEANVIAQANLVPKFEEGKHGEGLHDTVVALSQKISAAAEQLPFRGRYSYENANPPVQDQAPLLAIVLIIAIVGVLAIIIAYLSKKGKIRWKKISGDSTYSGRREPSGGSKGGGGRSGGGGAKGKW
jgi:uncharacterized protein